MALVFQRGSTLVLDSGSVSRRFLISSASLNQTFLEERTEVRTLHNNNQINNTYTNSKGEASIEFEVYLTNEDGLLLEWFGLINSAAKKYSIVPTTNLPEGFDLYLESNGATYKVSQVYPKTLSFSFSKQNPLMLSVSATGAKWEEVPSGITPDSIQDHSLFTVGGISGISNLAGISLELTRNVTWLANKTTHDALSGNIFTNNKITTDNYSIAGTITKYKRDDSLTHSVSGIVDFTYNDFLRVYLDPCKLLDRWSTDEVHRKMTDYMLLPSTSDSFIEFI